MIVIADASAVGTFLLEDEAGDFADFARSACLDNVVHVPAIWPTEMTSLILKAYRRNRINGAERDEALATAETLRMTMTIALDQPIATLGAQATFAGLSAYDTSYALLALRLDAPLLTGDGPLRRAADKLGFKVLLP